MFLFNRHPRNPYLDVFFGSTCGAEELQELWGLHPPRFNMEAENDAFQVRFISFSMGLMFRRDGILLDLHCTSFLSQCKSLEVLDDEITWIFVHYFPACFPPVPPQLRRKCWLFFWDNQEPLYGYGVYLAASWQQFSVDTWIFPEM